jgi:alpha-galactosidase
MGGGIVYDESDGLYCLGDMQLEWSDNGRGDYRQSPTELVMPDGSFVSDFSYASHAVRDGGIEMETLPSACGADQTLAVEMEDAAGVALTLYYSVFEKTDVITRRAVLKNDGEAPLVIRRVMRLIVDLPDEGFSMLTLDGAWIKEACLHTRPGGYGSTVNASTTGSSSNLHNPGFMLAARGATETHGRVYGFNLVYSGNHYGTVEKSEFDSVRVSLGINPHCFDWRLGRGGRFETPEAVMTFSAEGLGGLSRNMHAFVGGHIVRGAWKNRERPVLINNWEACFFNFNESGLLRLAKAAKELGIELFVLDDGWFGARMTIRPDSATTMSTSKSCPAG